MQLASGLLDLAARSIRQAPVVDVAATYKLVVQMLLQAFDLSATTAHLEQATRAAYIALALKLNETTFKPVFLRTVDWAFLEVKLPGSSHLIFVPTYLELGLNRRTCDAPPAGCS